ncbi:MAG TPA: xanthine dehydrogenase family protein subunit M [Rhizomicrobium sp.]|nr:xanthine dehydrogenase family protein subunit M [Rhizomicrobium sp.]
MIPYPFTYHRPASLKNAEALLASLPDAKLLAGGHTLIPAMKLRLANPAALIDIARLPELSFIHKEGDRMLIGAATTHAEVASSDVVRSAIPALARLAEVIGDPAVRHMGTLGGSIANNDPAADYPAGLLALATTVHTTRRQIAVDDFFTGMFSTALEEGEIVTQVEIPLPKRASYAKFANPASRYALVGVFVADTAGGIRVAVTGAASCVFRATEMEVALGHTFTPDAITPVCISPEGLNSDLHGSAEYRAHLITVIARRAVAAALDDPR